MRLRFIYALFFTVALSAHSQTTADPEPGLPKDPREILAAAAPFYDFTSPEVKPWYLKATYQLYDQDGKPTEKGSYERWWASPKVFRESWTRPGATLTDWHTAEGKHLFKATGKRLKYFERQLQPALFSPLRGEVVLNSEEMRLALEMKSLKGAEFPCIFFAPMKAIQPQLPPFSLGPTYCFDEHLPVLRARFDSDILTTEFNNIAKVQGRFLAREILILAQVESFFLPKWRRSVGWTHPILC
jgi:hypothetical protein